MKKNERKVEMKFFVDGKEAAIKDLTPNELQKLARLLKQTDENDLLGDPTKGVPLNPRRYLGGLG